MPEGLGTAEQPYLIRDVRDLGTVWFKPLAHYRLEGSLDLSGITWSMAAIPWFRGSFDGNGHVNNVVYVQWMEDVGILHARKIGAEKIARSLKGSWYARSHRIEYLKPAFADDHVIALTWIAECKGVRSRRSYRFLRKSDKTLLAEAETEFIFVGTGTGRPKKIPVEISQLFLVVDDPVKF